MVPMMDLLFVLQVHTLCIGAAAGHACLILAAGKKGKRYMFPHAKGKKV
jgi:ATP-dependent protease ClpP protease subunit